MDAREDGLPVLCISTAQALRRDFADRLVEASFATPARELTALLAAWTEPIDLLGAIDGDADPSVRRFRRLAAGAGAATALLLVADGALRQALAELGTADPLQAPLRRILAGESALVGGHRILRYDDRRQPALGWVAGRAEVRDLFERVRRLADESLPVLVTGESGTGKELVARGLHALGRRSAEPWVAANCAELCESLLESELFGHARGAFTGAVADRAGLFEQAGRGTLFLDEIGELPLAAQAKLLRVLEQHRVRRVGAVEARPLGCRIVAATNRDLRVEAAAGRFRSDLYYRLRGAEIRLPPLRARGEHVLGIAEAFLARASLRFARPGLRLDASAAAAIRTHRWPGNFRELGQAIDAAVLGASAAAIGAADLPCDEPADPGLDDENGFVTVRAVEKAHILRALFSTAGNKLAAARVLGLTRQSLDRRIARHGIGETLDAYGLARFPARSRSRRPDGRSVS